MGDLLKRTHISAISIALRGIICPLLLCSASLFGMSAQDSLYKQRCEALDLPILYIVTQDSVMPTYTVIEPPPGCDGLGITDNEKLPARMVIVLANDTIYDSGEYKKDTSGLTIKVRGNTTAAADSVTGKKPYKLKLQQKKDLLFRDNESVYADKDWVLLRIGICMTMVGNMANRAMGMDWTPEQQPVFVFLNDDFRGLYLLSENIKRNTKCRVDISKTGYLFEFDAYWWNAEYYLESQYRYNYTLKYPDLKDTVPEQIEYLTNHIQTVEAYYNTPDVLDSVIDIPSYARWLWVHDIIGSKDGCGSNMFLIKNDETTDSKQAMICTWDFDGSFAQKAQWSSVHNRWWFKDFFDLPQRQFVKEYIRMYDAMVPEVFDSLVNEIDTLIAAPLMVTLDSAFVLESRRWKNEKPAHTQFQKLADYLTERKPVIDSLINEIKDDYVDVETSLPQEVHFAPRKECQAPQEYSAYDILGRPVSQARRGEIIIIRGNDGSVKKTYVK